VTDRRHPRRPHFSGVASALDPHRDPLSSCPTILLFVAGLTPQIVTETLYCLLVQRIPPADIRAVLPLGWVRLTFNETEPPPFRPVSAPDMGRERVSPAAGAPAGPGRDQAPLPQPPQPPPAPRRDPHVIEAENLIRTLEPHEIVGRLQAVATAIGRCPSEEHDRLVALFRARQEEMKLKAKDVKANMESLVKQLQESPSRQA
jgi:hypothetical protein